LGLGATNTYNFVMKKVYLFLIQTLMVLSLVLAVSCSKADDKGEDVPSGELKVGKSYQGGF